MLAKPMYRISESIIDVSSFNDTASVYFCILDDLQGYNESVALEEEEKVHYQTTLEYTSVKSFITFEVLRGYYSATARVIGFLTDYYALQDQDYMKKILGINSLNDNSFRIVPLDRTMLSDDPLSPNRDYYTAFLPGSKTRLSRNVFFERDVSFAQSDYKPTYVKFSKVPKGKMLYPGVAVIAIILKKQRSYQNYSIDELNAQTNTYNSPNDIGGTPNLISPGVELLKLTYNISYGVVKT